MHQWGTALVTGGSRGIGRGIVFELAENGIKKIAINYVENARGRSYEPPTAWRTAAHRGLELALVNGLRVNGLDLSFREGLCPMDDILCVQTLDVVFRKTEHR